MADPAATHAEPPETPVTPEAPDGPIAPIAPVAPVAPVTKIAGPTPPLLLFSVLVVATCGLVYELITATMASYLLGDSVTQFSLVIGVYLSAMGLGSYLSRFVVRRLANRFVHIQLIIAIVGGFSAPTLFLGFSVLSSIRPLLFSILVIVGTLVGLEIPLLMRLMPGKQELKDHVARVLAFDYIGALLASIASVSPYIGLFGTVWGIMNSFIGLANQSQANISVVAPGIAEALIATAMGLFAAIPAVVAFNRFSSQVERLEVRYDNFREEFASILHRQARKLREND